MLAPKDMVSPQLLARIAVLEARLAYIADVWAAEADARLLSPGPTTYGGAPSGGNGG